MKNKNKSNTGFKKREVIKKSWAMDQTINCPHNCPFIIAGLSKDENTEYSCVRYDITLKKSVDMDARPVRTLDCNLKKFELVLTFGEQNDNDS